MLFRALLPALLCPLLWGCPHDLNRRPSPGDSAVLDGCASAQEICDGKDNNCDGKIDEGFDLLSDPLHCGGCGQACAFDNALAACEKGICAMKSCARGSTGDLTHWDVDGKTNNGCEYACSITAGGHEACDGKDNDCDGKTDESCASLVLLYRFDDAKWDKVTNMATPANPGKISGAVRVCGQVSGGVAGEGSDGCAAYLDGFDDIIEETPTETTQLVDCDAMGKWQIQDKAGSITKTRKEGQGALLLQGHSGSYGSMAVYTGDLDLKAWVEAASNRPAGYLVFWAHIQAVSHSQLGIVELGNFNNDRNAVWNKSALYVLGPTQGAYSDGWNLVALPFAKATYTSRAQIDWAKIKWLQFYSTKPKDTGVNPFILDDIRVVADLSQLFSSFTAMAWVRPAAASRDSYVLSKADDQPAIQMEPSTNKVWHFRLSTKDVLPSKSPIKRDAWSHLALVYDGKEATAYVDGALQGQRIGDFVPGAFLRIGGDGNKGQYFEGRVDEVALYSRALSKDELTRYIGLFRPGAPFLMGDSLFSRFIPHRSGAGGGSGPRP